MTDRQSYDPAAEWLTVGQAAEQLGLSPSGFRGLAKTEGLTLRRRGNQPGVLRADVDAYLDRARIQPGGITAARETRDLRTGRQDTGEFAAYEPYAKKPTADVPGLVEATILRDEYGWTDNDIARVLHIHYSNVYRRRINGFSPQQVQGLQLAIRLVNTDRT